MLFGSFVLQESIYEYTPLNQIIIRNAESMIFSLLNFEYKMIFMKIQKPVLFHLSEFKRQAAALDRKIICKLLP